MNKFHLIIYNSALLLLLVVQYSESVENVKNEIQLPNNPVTSATNGAECVNFVCQWLARVKGCIYKYIAAFSTELDKPPSKNEPSPDKSTSNLRPDEPFSQDESQRAKLVGYKSAESSDERLCEFSIDVRTTNTLPLLLQSDPSSPLDFFYPNAGPYNIVLNKGEKIRLACPGKDNLITKFSDVKNTYGADIVAGCEGKNLFTYEGKSFKIDEIECELPPASIIHYTNKKCLPQFPEKTAEYVEIRFDLNSKEFVRTIGACYENSTRTIYWAGVRIPRKIEAVQKCENHKVGEPKIDFPPNESGEKYDIKEQRKTVLDLTKSNNLVKKYIKEQDGKKRETGSWVTRSQLVRDGSFLYCAAQTSAYSWINQAPQWSSLGNWDSLESSIEKLFGKLEHPIIIYSGTYGQMSLSLGESTNVGTTESVPYYLSVNATDASKNAVPVPKYFWKILYNEHTGQNTAFVTVNDPWATPENAGLKDYCRDISTKLDWLDWHPENATLGLSYVCEVSKLRNLIPTLPDLHIHVATRVDSSQLIPPKKKRNGNQGQRPEVTTLDCPWYECPPCEYSDGQRRKGYTSEIKPSDENVCQFSIDVQDSTTLPLLLKPKPSLAFMTPDPENYMIKLEKGAYIRLACPGPNNYITKYPHGGKHPTIVGVSAQCQGNNSFTTASESFRIDDIMCYLPPMAVPRATNKECLGKAANDVGKYVEIGFVLNPTEFLKSIDVCWNYTTKTTYWTKLEIPTRIKNVQDYHGIELLPPDVISYGPNRTSKPYVFGEQLKTVEALTGSADAARFYIKNSDLAVSKAALTSRQSFVYYSEQIATDWYMNQAPQWNELGNWQYLEISIKTFVENIKQPLIIYAGTHGQMTLIRNISENVEHIPFNLYLDADDPNKNDLPVPKYFWKILYDPLAKKGTAFVVVNDPWAKAEDAGVQKNCEQISENLPWLRWVPRFSKYGLSYVCKVDEKLRKFIPTIPDIDVKDVLV